MSFGQTSGPPASAKQVSYLLSLVRKAGHADFRDARGPLGLTQRQAGGKFTKNEASTLIDRLLGGEAGEGGEGGVGGRSDEGREGLDPAGGEVGSLPSVDVRYDARAEAAAARLEAERVSVLRGVPAELLAAELERRGWQVVDPDTVSR